MVSRLVALMRGEWSSLHQAALILAGAALTSQLLALVRDRLFASSFGVGELLDLYYAAFRIPDLVYVTVASFVSLTVLIPVMTKKFAAQDRQALDEFFNGILTVFGIVMLTVSVLLYLLMPVLVPLIAPGFDRFLLPELITLSRIMLLSPFLLGLSNIFGAVTQVKRKFALYACAPVLYNVGIIAGVLLLYPLFGLSGLAWGVVLGALGHLTIQLPAVYGAGLDPAVSARIPWKDVRSVVLVSFPRTLTLAAHQLVLLVCTAIASLIGAGAIATFTFAWNLQSVPLAIIGVSYSVAAFPTLSALVARGERSKFSSEVLEALRHLAVWSLLVTVLTIVLRAHLVRAILGAGAFDWQATRLTAAALALFIVSLLAQSVVLLLVRGYYAAGLTRRPLVVNGVSSLVTVALVPLLLTLFSTVPWFARTLELLLRVEGVPGTSMLMLPLAFSLGLVANALVLWYYFSHDFACSFTPLRRSMAEGLLTALVAGATAYATLFALAPAVRMETFLGILIQGSIAGFLALLMAYLTLRACESRELEALQTALARRMRKQTLVIPGPEEGA